MSERQTTYSSTEDPYFDSIRPYTDKEVKEALGELIEDREFCAFARTYGFDLGQKEVRQHFLDEIGSVLDFKRTIIAPGLRRLLEKTAFGASLSGTGNLDKTSGTKYLLISNHRDIILDPAITDALFLEHGLSVPQMTLGDNLLKRPWIKTLVRLCDGIIVHRGLPVRETLTESQRLSDYIRTAITTGEEHIWLAQGDGRAKDANDTTQPGLLKMLAMSAPRDHTPAKAIEELHLLPMTISYEYDPCDSLKALELLRRERSGGEYHKQPMEDLISMATGLRGQKGRIHIRLGEPLTNVEQLLTPEMNRNEQFATIAREIDRQIFLGYHFYPSNYIAFDIVRSGDRFASMYSRKEYLRFQLYVEEQMDQAKVPTDDREEVARRIYTAYANPLINNLVTRKIIRR